MRIIQTFWSADKDIMEDHFGWLSAQYHLMGWALSCLKLCEHYKEVELYTDSAGYKMLIETLQLPYTKVHVVLDDMQVHKKELWALAKIKTYSLQEEPFIHVDGDVFIWDKLPDNLYEAPLIAQNLERATDYYGGKMKELGDELLFMPPGLNLDVINMDLCSCNAGIIGGSDLAFFKRYSGMAFEMVNKNEGANLGRNAWIDFNIVFEQFLFYQMAALEGKYLRCLFSKVYTDFGYDMAEVGDLTTLPFTTGYIHLLGTHKRNATACELMAGFLLSEYTAFYFRIKGLFKEAVDFDLQATNDRELIRALFYCDQLPFNYRQESKACMIPDRSEMAAIKELAEYQTMLAGVLNGFGELSPYYLVARDLFYLDSYQFFLQPGEKQLTTSICRDPLLTTVEVTRELAGSITGNIDLEDKVIDGGIYVAIVPDLTTLRYKQVILEYLECLILTLLDNKMQLTGLLKHLEACFKREELEEGYDNFYQLIMIKLKGLSLKGCIKIYMQ